MKKYRVNTTISQKHHVILKELAEKYGTQQSVLEHALERLKNKDDQGELSKEEELWLQIYREMKDVLSLLQRDLVTLLFDTVDFQGYEDYIKKVNPALFAVEWYYNKPLKECTLQELVEGLIMNIKMQGTSDSINYTEDENSYTMNWIHNLGINCSKALVIMNEMVLESYGAKFEDHYTQRSIYFTIYK